MIALDPEFIGSLAPPPTLSTAVGGQADVSFARLPRLERLRVQGKADETEEGDEDEAAGGDEAPTRKPTREEKEKKKMRGRNKTLKRCVFSSRRSVYQQRSLVCRYLRKQRKNVIDPRAVCLSQYFHLCCCSTTCPF